MENDFQRSTQLVANVAFSTNFMMNICALKVTKQRLARKSVMVGLLSLRQKELGFAIKGLILFNRNPSV
jgi:hypothetical protein